MYPLNQNISTMYDKQDVVRSYQTLIEMMHDRDIDTSLMQRFQSEELATMASSQAIFVVPVVQGEDANENHIQVIYNLNPKVKQQDIKKLVETYMQNVPHTLLVFKEPLTSQNAKPLLEAAAKGLRIEIFELKELLFNVSRHELVPKHQKVNDETVVKDILTAAKIKSKTQLPIILKTDPMARYLGLRTGDVVRITRPSPTSGIYVHYRCCV